VYLTLPVWKYSKSFCVSILIELGIVTTFELACHIVSHWKSRLVPEPGVLATLVIFVSKLEVKISPIGISKEDFIFIGFEIRGGIHKPFECMKVSQC
jgi:hypothetical protein